MQDVQTSSLAWQAKKLDELQCAQLLGLSSTRRDPSMRQPSPNGIHKVEGKSSTSDYETAPSEVRCAPSSQTSAAVAGIASAATKPTTSFHASMRPG